VSWVNAVARQVGYYLLGKKGSMRRKKYERNQEERPMLKEIDKQGNYNNWSNLK